MRSAGFFVVPVSSAVRAELLDLEAIGIVAPVLAGDVVAVFAFFASHRDLRAYVSGSHGR